MYLYTDLYIYRTINISIIFSSPYNALSYNYKFIVSKYFKFVSQCAHMRAPKHNQQPEFITKTPSLCRLFGELQRISFFLLKKHHIKPVRYK